jgi:hypothetical protein
MDPAQHMFFSPKTEPSKIIFLKIFCGPVGNLLNRYRFRYAPIINLLVQNSTILWVRELGTGTSWVPVPYKFVGTLSILCFSHLHSTKLKFT